MVNTKIRLIILFAVKDGEALYSHQPARPGADCGSDHKCLIAKFRLKLKGVGKKWQIQRMRSDRVPEETMDGILQHCVSSGDQNHPQEKEMQEGEDGCQE